MATYNTIFQSTFDPIGVNPISPVYTFKILQKNNLAVVRSFTLSSIPVIHSWQTDDPKAPIKGSSLTVNLLNEGSLPLKTFYASEDDTFRGQLFYFNQLLFDGFLVQDDCQEILVDFTHEIQLSFTDNLGLLKDIPFDKAPVNFALVFNDNNVLSTTAPNKITMGSIYANSIKISDQIKIAGSTPQDGTYNITAIQIVGGNVEFTTAEVIGTMGSIATAFSVYRSSVYEKKSLLEIIKACLLATGLELNTNIYCNLRETTQSSTRSFLEQTLITAETFMSSETDWMSCYDVLNKIFERFNLTLAQSNGVWNIVRWDELRYSFVPLSGQYQIPGFIYDKDFNYVGTVTSGFAFSAGKDQVTKPETGYLNRVFRPYKYDKETFNYRQPNQLLKNANLQQLGTLLRNYTSGTLGNADYRKIFEYTMPWWEYSDTFPTQSGSLGSAEFFIRVIKDQVGNEVERNAVVRKNNIRSYKVEVNQGDKFNFSFRFRMSQIYNGPANIPFFVQITDGTQTKYITGSSDSEITRWENAGGYIFRVKAGDSAKDNWQSVDIPSAAIPFDGLVRVYLHSIIAAPNETKYQDIRFEYTSLINESIKVTGQTHISNQPLTVKNKEDVEIYMDSAPKNSLSGTLFLKGLNGLLQKRTDRWTRGFAFTESKRLGELTTFETLFARKIPRTILEGRLYGLVQSSAHLSILTPFKYTENIDLNLIWGKLDIDYKNNNATGTLWESHQDYEALNDNLLYDYSFNYLYAPK